MKFLSQYVAPVALSAALAAGALMPAPARAQDDQLARVLVDIADVVIRSGTPYYRYGNYGYDDRLIVSRDRYGRPVYYRYVPRHVYRQPVRYVYVPRPVYRPAYYRYQPRYDHRRVKCNPHGKCKVSYYDGRYDRDHDRYSRNDRYERYRYRDDD